MSLEHRIISEGSCDFFPFGIGHETVWMEVDEVATFFIQYIALAFLQMSFVPLILAGARFFLFLFF